MTRICGHFNAFEIELRPAIEFNSMIRSTHLLYFKILSVYPAWQAYLCYSEHAEAR